MVFTGHNLVRDLVAGVVSYGILGTGSTAEAQNQTALVGAQTATSSLVSTQTADKQLIVDYSLSSTLGNGTTFTELGVFNTTDGMFSRHVFSSLTKSSVEQWQFSVIYRFN